MNDNDIDIDVLDEREVTKNNVTNTKTAATQDNRLLAMQTVMAEILEGVNYSTDSSKIKTISNPSHSGGTTMKLREMLEPSHPAQPTMRTKNGHTQLLRNHLSSRTAIKSSPLSSLASVGAASATANTNATMQKSHKTDAPMLNYIFDSHLATNKHHHYDR